MQLYDLIHALGALDKKRKEHVAMFDELNTYLRRERFALYWDDENERYCVYPIPMSLTGSDKQHDE